MFALLRILSDIWCYTGLLNATGLPEKAFAPAVLKTRQRSHSLVTIQRLSGTSGLRNLHLIVFHLFFSFIDHQIPLNGNWTVKTDTSERPSVGKSTANLTVVSPAEILFAGELAAIPSGDSFVGFVRCTTPSQPPAKSLGITTIASTEAPDIIYSILIDISDEIINTRLPPSIRSKPGNKISYQTEIRLHTRQDRHFEPFSAFAAVQRGRIVPEAPPLTPDMILAAGYTVLRSRQQIPCNASTMSPFSVRLHSMAWAGSDMTSKRVEIN